MTNYAEFFNPELEGILQEIAKDPKAKLLDIPSSGQLVCATHDFRVGVSAPGLTAAEVELLTVHREDLGELLKQRCLIEFFAQPDADILWHKSVTVDRQLEVRDEKLWRADAEKAIALPSNDEKVNLASDVLGRCIAGDSERPVSITQLSTAMLRVDPQDQARIYIASEHFREGRLEIAKATATEVAGQTTNLLASYCADLIGRVGAVSDEWDASLEAYSRSHEFAPSRIVSLMSGVALAVEFGAKQDAIRFGELLNEFVSDDNLALIDFCGAIHSRILNDRSLLDAFNWSLAHELISKFGDSPAGMLIHAHTK